MNRVSFSTERRKNRTKENQQNSNKQAFSVYSEFRPATYSNAPCPYPVTLG